MNNKNKSRIIAGILALSAVFSLNGCSNTQSSVFKRENSEININNNNININESGITYDANGNEYSYIVEYKNGVFDISNSNEELGYRGCVYNVPISLISRYYIFFKDRNFFVPYFDDLLFSENLDYFWLREYSNNNQFCENAHYNENGDLEYSSFNRNELGNAENRYNFDGSGEASNLIIDELCKINGEVVSSSHFAIDNKVSISEYIEYMDGVEYTSVYKSYYGDDLYNKDTIIKKYENGVYVGKIINVDRIDDDRLDCYYYYYDSNNNLTKITNLVYVYYGKEVLYDREILFENGKIVSDTYIYTMDDRNVEELKNEFGISNQVLKLVPEVIYEK